MSLVFDTLGPLEVRRSGRVLPVGPPQRRRLLIRLLIADGAPVARDDLLHDLWRGEPPGGAVASVHAHVSRLREVLGAEGIARDAAGYRLLSAAGARSSVRYEISWKTARKLYAVGETAAARGVIEAGLAGWRGAAYADAAAWPFARAAAARLEEIRTAGAELHVRILLAAGETALAVEAARRLVVAHPVRETAGELLIESLSRAGMPMAALDQRNRMRARLADLR
ncbi:BTAD domain-containing putative transcriptional regulator [Actinoplanes sp. NPDC051851]|uniref:AfsR/SARP family transcriptional regulator n=1 Tax=Actinoplanes sp. NPDC051851 TaxID=3154753 RepID=UPI003441E1BC